MLQHVCVASDHAAYFFVSLGLFSMKMRVYALIICYKPILLLSRAVNKSGATCHVTVPSASLAAPTAPIYLNQSPNCYLLAPYPSSSMCRIQKSGSISWQYRVSALGARTTLPGHGMAILMLTDRRHTRLGSLRRIANPIKQEAQEAPQHTGVRTTNVVLAFPGVPVLSGGLKQTEGV